MEEQVFRKGLHKQPSMLEYKSPTTLETPEIHTILVETDDPEGPFGAKEAGQGPLLPVIPAIANAIYHAVGVRIDEVPITPDMILQGLELKRQGKPARIGPERAPAVPRSRSRSPSSPPSASPPTPIALRDSGRSPVTKITAGNHPDQATHVEPGGPAHNDPAAPFTYLSPKTVEQAVRAVADAGPDAMLVAGGTDLYPNMKRRQFEPKMLVGLRAIRELRGVARRRARRAARSAPARRSPPSPRTRSWRARYPALATAAGLVSSPQLRNMGTIGGNVCVDTRCNYYNQSYEWRKAIGFCMKKDGDICLVAPGSSRCWAVSSSDTAPVLWSLGAQRHGWSGPPASARCRSPRSTRTTASQYLRQAPRRDRDRRSCCRRPTAGARPTSSCAGAARSTSRCSAWPSRSRLEGDVVREARIVLGAVASLPREATQAAGGAGRPAAHRRD